MFAGVPLVLTFVNELPAMTYECQNRDTSGRGLRRRQTETPLGEGLVLERPLIRLATLATLSHSGERLSFRSSDFWLPWRFVSQDCVEDGEQLSGNGDEGHQLGFARDDELIAEPLEFGIEAR